MTSNKESVFRMTLFTADCIENPKNAKYPHEITVKTADDMRRALRKDHMASKMRESYRNTDYFIGCDCIMTDIDNTHSEDPDAWKTADDISDALPVNYVLSQSRNYMKEKRKTGKDGKVTVYEPREKWHVYFPLASPISDVKEFNQVMHHIQALFPFIDSSAKDAARFFFGVKDPKITVENGGMYIDEFLSGADPGELQRREEEELRDYAAKVLDGTYKNNDSTRNTVSSICSFLGIADPLGDADHETKSQTTNNTDEDLPEWLRRVEQETSLEWLKRWAKRHKVKLGRIYRFNQQAHPDALAICVSCPWEDEHSEEGADNEAVIIIELSGQLDFKCRHSHGGRLSWKKYRAKVEADSPEPDAIQGDSTPAVVEIESLKDDKLQLVRTSAGRVAAIFSNYTEIVRKDPLLRDKLMFDTLSGRPVISGVPWDLDAHPVRDNDLHHIREHISTRYGIQNKEDVRQAVEMIAESRPYNPVEKMLQGLEWDGEPRIRELFPRYLGAERSDYTEAVTLTLLHGAIQRAINPGVKFDLCLILADHRQGTGKSTMCRLLALQDEWFCDSLGDLADTDKAFETVRGHWICELGELLATRRTKDIEATKAYLSRQYDTYRPKYHTYSESYPRRCVFIGTTNAIAYLPEDRTGNRRFIPLPCDGDRQEVHPLANEEETREYIRQCYAEAMERGRRDGWQLILPKECAEVLAEHQEEATPEDPKVGMIQEWLDTVEVCGQDGTTKTEPIKYVCTEMIRDILFYGSVKPHERREIANILSLKIKGWKRYQGKDGKSKSGRVRFRGTLMIRDKAGIVTDFYSLEKYGNQKAWIREDTCIPGCIPHDDFVSPGKDTDVPFDNEEIDFG